MAKPWTRAEINTLRENYGRMTYPKMAELLPGRTPGGIGTKASEMRLILGDKPPRHPKKSVPWHLRSSFRAFIEEIRRGLRNGKPTTTNISSGSGLPPTRQCPSSIEASPPN